VSLNYFADWVCPQIGDVADVIAGGTPSAGNPENFSAPGQDIAWLTPADLSKYDGKYISHGARDLSKLGYESSSAKLMPTGALLFSSRAPIGYVVIAANEIATNQGFKNFVFTKDVDSTYAYYFLKSIRQLAESLGTGTTFKEISGSTAKTLPFVLAPLAEQQQIAQKLDELLAQVDTLKPRLDAIPNILKRFRQSVLAAAVSGRLTEEWRGSDEYEAVDLGLSKKSEAILFPLSWKKHRLNDVCEVISGNAFKSGDFIASGIPAIKISNVQYGQFEIKNQEYLPEQYLQQYKKFVVSSSDLLMALTRPITNNTLKICRYPNDVPQGLLNQRVCKFNFKNELEKTFFECLFQSDYFKHQVEDNLSETLQPNLSPTDLKRFIVGVPPIEEQTEIVRRVEQLFAYADQIEQRVKDAQARVNHLTQSILAKAFRGELTADWRAQNPALISGENSAAALLERIRAEREVAVKPKRKARA